MTIDFEIPIRVVSEANQREHWAKRSVRVKHQKYYAAVFAPRGMKSKLSLPLTVKFTRTYPNVGKPMDTDNLAGSFKHVQDVIAELLGVDDGDGRIEWQYAQEKVGGKDYGVQVKIAEKTEAR